MCPSCLDAFEVAESTAAPMLYDNCMHNVCRACVASRELAEDLVCPVCRVDQGPPKVDAVLSDFAVTMANFSKGRVPHAPTPDQMCLRQECTDLAEKLQGAVKVVDAQKAESDAAFNTSFQKFIVDLESVHGNLDKQKEDVFSESTAKSAIYMEVMDAEIQELTEIIGRLRQAVIAVDAMPANSGTVAEAEAAFADTAKWQAIKIRGHAIEIRMDFEIWKMYLATVSCSRSDTGAIVFCPCL